MMAALTTTTPVKKAAQARAPAVTAPGTGAPTTPMSSRQSAAASVMSGMRDALLASTEVRERSKAERLEALRSSADKEFELKKAELEVRRAEAKAKEEVERLRAEQSSNQATALAEIMRVQSEQFKSFMELVMKSLK